MKSLSKIHDSSSKKTRKSILTIDKQIQSLESEITYFFYTHSDLKNKNMIEQISLLSKLHKKIGILFDLYRDYALVKSKLSK